MSEELEKRVRLIEQSASFLKGFIAAITAVGIGIGAMALWAFDKASKASAMANAVEIKAPQITSNIEKELKSRFWNVGLQVTKLREIRDGVAPYTGFLFLTTVENVEGRVYGVKTDNTEDYCRQTAVKNGQSALIPITKGTRYRVDSNNFNRTGLYLIYTDFEAQPSNPADPKDRAAD